MADTTLKTLLSYVAGQDRPAINLIGSLHDLGPNRRILVIAKTATQTCFLLDKHRVAIPAQ